MMVTAYYTFRPLTGHHQVVRLKKRVRAVRYNVYCTALSPSLSFRSTA